MNGSGAWVDRRLRYGFFANQITTTANAKTIAPHSNGVTSFELPLRGELLAAGSNSRFINAPFGSAAGDPSRSTL